MINAHRTIISSEKITDNLSHILSASSDETILYLKVDLKIEGKGGPFQTEKSFRNNIFGLEDMRNTILSFSTEERVRKYFGIGEEE